MGLRGAGRALGHGAVLLRGRTVVRVTLAGIHLLLAEVDAQNLPRCLPLAARYRALGHRERRVIAPVGVASCSKHRISQYDSCSQSDVFKDTLHFSFLHFIHSSRWPKPELSGTNVSTPCRCNLQPTRVESPPIPIPTLCLKRRKTIFYGSPS